MNLAKQYLVIKEKMKIVEDFIDKEKEELEKKLSNKFGILEKLKEEELNTKLLLIDEMKKNDVKTLEIEDKLIIQQVRNTFKIQDEDILYNTIKENSRVFLKLVEDKKITKTSELLSYLTQRKFDTKKTIEIIDRYQKLEGIVPKGSEIHSTEFLTIKNKLNA